MAENPKSKIQRWSTWGYMDLDIFAKRIREACTEAALQAYEDAGIQGLCADGRWEAVVSALRTIDLTPLLRELEQSFASSQKGRQVRRRNRP